MSETFPVIYLALHCESAWTETRQHTDHSDLPLTERGKENLPALEEAIVAGIPVNITDLESMLNHDSSTNDLIRQYRKPMEAK